MRSTWFSGSLSQVLRIRLSGGGNKMLSRLGSVQAFRSTTPIQPHFNLGPAMGDDLVTNLPTLFSPSTCVRRGLCPVTTLRKQDSPVESHSLYFGRYRARFPRRRQLGVLIRTTIEQHGTGPDKILLIMGYVECAGRPKHNQLNLI